MKLLSLNVNLFDDNKFKVIDYIDSIGPDIVVLQEVANHLDESVKDRYKAKELIDLKLEKKYPYSFYMPFWAANYFQKGDQLTEHFEGDVEFGIYVISKYEIVSAKSVYFCGDSYSYYTDWSHWPNPDFTRGMQDIIIKLGREEIRVVNVDGIWTRDKKGNDRTMQECLEISTYLKDTKHPLIIAGDFNLFPDTNSIKVLNQQFSNLCDLFEIRSTRPENNELNDQRNVVDFIFTNKKIKVNDFKVDQIELSDHLPLILDFDIS